MTKTLASSTMNKLEIAVACARAAKEEVGISFKGALYHSL